MRIGIIGINHKSADLQLREKLAKACERLFNPTHSLHSFFSLILLSTCNRTEIYFYAEDPAEAHTYLLNVLRSEIEEEFEHRIYSYFGSDCFFHLARVTAGVDSALIGETEIQGQVKRAYETAHRYSTLAPELHFLFQKCLKIGKNIRNKTVFSQNLPSLDEAILNVGWRFFNNLLERKILFVGLSEINYKIFSRFKQIGCRHLALCNRTQYKAQVVAERDGAAVLPWEELAQWITFDLAIFGTKSPNFLVGREHLTSERCCQLVIDLSVPRNVDPKVGRHATLLNIDQLNRAIDRKRKLKAADIGRIETQIIAGAVDKQLEIFKLKELQRSYALSTAI